MDANVTSNPRPRTNGALAAALLVCLASLLAPALASGLPAPGPVPPLAASGAAVPPRDATLLPHPHAARAEAALALPGDLTYHGGPVLHAPMTYVVFWGWQGNDPYGAAPRLVDFLSGLGGSRYAAVQTQYTDGLGAITNPSSQFGGSWSDDATTPSNMLSTGDVAAEAARAVQHFGYDPDGIYFVATPTGRSTADFAANGGGACAWHSAFFDGTRWVPFVNLPYQVDAFTGCGGNAVNGGPAGWLDGVTINAGHEYAEAVTDPVPVSGWLDAGISGENGDKCAWRTSGVGAMRNVALTTGSFAVQSLWSNADHACIVEASLADLHPSGSWTASVAGAPATLTATLANAGPDPAAHPRLTATLPTGFHVTGLSASHGSCSAAPTLVTCLPGLLSANATATFHITGTPAAGALTSTVTADAAACCDTAPANDVAHAGTTVARIVADLAVTASGATAAVAGQAAAVQFTVTDLGPDAVPDARLQLSVPAATVVTPAQGTCSGGPTTYVCLLGAIASGQSANVTAQLTPARAGSWSLMATSSLGGGADASAADNRVAWRVVSRLPRVDLGVDLAASVPSVLAGSSVTWTATVANGGAEDAPASRLALALPPGTYATATPSQGACSRAASLLTCTFGALARNATASVAIDVTPARAGRALASATASAPGATDTQASNDRSAQAVAVVAPRTDLWMHADTVAASASTPFSVTAHATNNGTDAAPGARVSLTVPVGTAYVSATPSQGTCTRAAAVVTCLTGPLASGATVDVVLVLQPLRAGPSTLVASAAALSPAVDAVLANNALRSPFILA